MPIEEHKNLGLEGVGQEIPGVVAAGSSNSNSHNAGGSTDLTPEQVREIVSQLAAQLPSMEQAKA
jgi:hypothetical protein